MSRAIGSRPHTALSTPDITWTHPGLVRILAAIPDSTNSLLDVGSGRGLIGALCRIYRRLTRSVAVDVYTPYLQFCRGQRTYDHTVRADFGQSGLPFRSKSFDIATCIEVIEHLDRESGRRLLDELERVASSVILTTPARFFAQDSFDENPWQKHKSVWSVRDFELRGYLVRGVDGLSAFASSPSLSYATAPLTWVFPRLASSYLCLKRRNPCL